VWVSLLGLHLDGTAKDMLDDRSGRGPLQSHTQ
jgi:hypothetical protein